MHVLYIERRCTALYTPLVKGLDCCTCISVRWDCFLHHWHVKDMYDRITFKFYGRTFHSCTIRKLRNNNLSDKRAYQSKAVKHLMESISELKAEMKCTNLALLLQFTQGIEHRLDVWNRLCDAVTIIWINTSVGNTQRVLQDLPQWPITCNSTYCITSPQNITYLLTTNNVHCKT